TDSLSRFYCGTPRGLPSVLKCYDDAVLAELAAAKGCTVAQLVLLWHLSRGRIVFPGASSTAHLAENLACLDFTLLKEEAEEIDNMDRFEAGRTGRHPDTFRRNGE
ncbi:aldo/keto reductase, partial [Actinotignum timonense]|nr:aldo/keto reductase [Actinotignum timonense]